MDRAESANSMKLAGIFVVVLVGVVATLTYSVTAQRRAVIRAQQEVKKGFGMLAAETVDPYREKLVKSEEGCKAAVMAYAAGRRVDRLEWAGEACIEHGIETMEVYEGLASAADLSGRDNDAIQVLSVAAQKFPKSAEPYFNMAKVYQKNKDENHAVAALLKTVELSGENHQLQLDTLQYLASVNRWTEAKQVADRLKLIDTDNPEVRLLLARTYLKAGDKVAAQEQVARGKELMGKRPADQQSNLKKIYSDVF